MKLREYLRVSFECPAEFSGEELFGEGTVVNLSLGGFAVESDQTVKPGMRLRLRIFLPNEDHPVIVQQVIVQWVKAGTFGLKTVSLDEENRNRLNELIVGSVNKSRSGQRARDSGRRSRP